MWHIPAPLRLVRLPQEDRHKLKSFLGQGMSLGLAWATQIDSFFKKNKNETTRLEQIKFLFLHSANKREGTRGKEREHQYIIQCNPQHRMSTKYIHFELQTIPFIVLFLIIMFSSKSYCWLSVKTSVQMTLTSIS